MKIRRVGNSNVVTLPFEFEKLGFGPGAEVVVEQLDTGELRILPVERVRELIRKAAQQAVEEDREALQILADHDKK